MPDLRRGGASGAARPWRGAGARPGWRRFLWPLVFALVLILGGAESLVLGVIRMQDAAQLAAARVCAGGQTTGCRLDEPVTVVGLATESYGRGGTARVVHVRLPDGSPQTVYATDHDAGLWDRLAAAQVVSAELWNGSVIRLDDQAGHYLIADSSPEVTAWVLPIIGLTAAGAGGLLLAFCVRRIRHP